MSYPPQGGGWQQGQPGGWQEGQPGGWQEGQPGGWQQGQPGGWQDPAGGYIDPSSGQPAYVDPVSGQPTSYPGYAPQPTYPTSPEYGYQQAYPGYGVPVAAGPSTNGMSIAAMVVSLVALLSLPCYGVGGIVIGAVGAILGHVGRKQVNERAEQGAGMALAGIIMGWIAVGLGLIIVAVVAYFVWWAAHLPSTYPTDYPTT